MSPAPTLREGAHSATRSTRQRLDASTPQPRKRSTRVRPWGWYDVIWVAVTLIVASGLTSLVLSNHLTRLMPEVGRVGVRVALLLVFYLLELLVLSYLAHRRDLVFKQAYHLVDYSALPLRLSPETTTSHKRPLSTWASALWVVGLFFLLRVLAIIWNYATSRVNWPAPSSENMTSLFGMSTFGLLGATLSVVLLAPLIEELVFRVVMQETFAKKLPLALSVITQSLIFSLYHLSLWAALPNFLLALACGWLATRSKTLWPAITLHILYNAAVVAAAFYLAFRVT